MARGRIRLDIDRVSFKSRDGTILPRLPNLCPSKVRGKLPAITPGEMLLEEFLTPMGISQYRLAKEIAVPPQRIGEIVAGKRAITADTDLRLCRFFGLSNGYWLRAQIAHDTEVAQDALAKTLAKIKPWSGVNAKTRVAA